MSPRLKWALLLLAAAAGGGALLLFLLRSFRGLTLQQFRDIMPRLSEELARAYLPELNAAMAAADINTVPRAAAFLGQIAHESNELRNWLELADGLDYDVTVNAKKAGHLGNDQPGDGPKYKGRGPIQLTGKKRYRAAGAALGVDLVAHPELAADPRYGFRIATWFWNGRGLSALADQGPEALQAITLKINGGYNGLDARARYFAKAMQVLS